MCAGCPRPRTEVGPQVQVNASPGGPRRGDQRASSPRRRKPTPRPVFPAAPRSSLSSPTSRVSWDRRTNSPPPGNRAGRRGRRSRRARRHRCQQRGPALMIDTHRHLRGGPGLLPVCGEALQPLRSPRRRDAATALAMSVARFDDGSVTVIQQNGVRGVWADTCSANSTFVVSSPRSPTITGPARRAVHDVDVGFHALLHEQPPEYASLTCPADFTDTNIWPATGRWASSATRRPGQQAAASEWRRGPRPMNGARWPNSRATSCRVPRTDRMEELYPGVHRAQPGWLIVVPRALADVRDRHEHRRSAVALQRRSNHLT